MQTHHPLVGRFLTAGTERAAILHHLAQSWSASCDSRCEAVLAELIALSANSPTRLALIDEHVGGTLVGSSLATNQHAVLGRYLRLKPDSTAVTSSLVEALRTAPNSAAIHEAIAKICHDNQAAQANIVPQLIASRVEDLRAGTADRASRTALTGRCLNDIKALNVLLGVSPYKEACTAAFQMNARTT
jgi:hypothetical protein